MKIHLTPKNSILVAFSFATMLSVCTYLVYGQINHSPLESPTSGVLNANETVKYVNSSEPVFINPDTFTADMAFLGDVFWGRYINDWSMASEQKYNYPFRSLETIGKADNEYWVANLECPVTSQTMDSKTQEDLLKFTCSPEYLPYAKKWFDALGQANNHSDNMQEYEGYAQTQAYLKQSGIAHFGHFDNKLSNLCTVVAVPAQANYSLNESAKFTNSNTSEDYQRKYSKTVVPVALCGFHSVFRVLSDEEIAYINNFAKYIPTVSMPHSGVEYVTTPDQIKTSAYRGMIDAGSDMVMGGHPHSIQSTEAYKGKLIAYSLGNFIFDQQYNRMVTTSLGLRARLSIDYGTQSDAWQSLPESCFNVSIICPEIASLGQKPPITISYKPIYASSANKTFQVASPDEQVYIQNTTKIEQTLTSINN